MAGYNNYFPQTYTYTPNVYSGQSMGTAIGQTSTAATQMNGINWVQGEAGAKSVPVAPGQKALLMDSETNVFYVKSCDVSGMPLPLRIFEYKEVSNVATNAKSDDGPPNTYVTHEELEQAIEQLKSESVKPKEAKPNGFDI